MHSYINDKYQRMKQILNTFAEEIEIFIFENIFVWCIHIFFYNWHNKDIYCCINYHIIF